MGKAAAKEGDMINVKKELHTVDLKTNPPSTGPKAFEFKATINGTCSNNVNIMGQPAAMKDSEASGNSSHSPSGETFKPEPANKGIITAGSASVNINNKPAARDGDEATGCNNVTPPNQTGKVVVKDADKATVFIGD